MKVIEGQKVSNKSNDAKDGQTRSNSVKKFKCQKGKLSE
jgi:hypothetical protein